MTAAAASLSAAPVGYSINSDSGSALADGLFTIDLATGKEIERIGTVQTPDLSPDSVRLDVEGLAFDLNGTLFGIDDDKLKLFPISTETAAIDTANEQDIEGLPAGGGNDFGMSFACDGKLYVTSVVERSLYLMDTNTGTATRIGADGSLGVKISAIAAYGNPVRLYGLGNGIISEGVIDTPNLYEIDITDGTTREIGPLGPAAAQYTEGGLAFDESGQLWAITDRRQLLSSSQVMRINTTTGTATDVRNTNEQGFESLAVTSPRGCAPLGNGEFASYVVQKRFDDSNDITPVQLNLKCNTGLPLEQSLTVLPNPGDFGKVEVKFVVESFTDGALDCEVWEDTPPGYTADYDCQSATACSTAAGAGPCSFSGASAGQEDLCLIQNYVDPVAVTLTSQWEYTREELVGDENTIIDFYCRNAFDGDGEVQTDGTMRWSWLFQGNSSSQTATIFPHFSGTTSCWTVKVPPDTNLEAESTCSDPITIIPGDDQRSCLVTSTVFFEGIPSLNQYGLALIMALMLMTGLIAVRRAG